MFYSQTEIFKKKPHISYVTQIGVNTAMCPFRSTNSTDILTLHFFFLYYYSFTLILAKGTITPLLKVTVGFL